MNFNIFQGTFSQIRARSLWLWDTQIKTLTYSFLNVNVLTLFSAHFLKALIFFQNMMILKSFVFDKTELWPPSCGIWIASTSTQLCVLSLCRSQGSASHLAPGGTSKRQIIITFSWCFRNLNLLYFPTHPDPPCGQKQQNPCGIRRFRAKLKHCPHTYNPIRLWTFGFASRMPNNGRSCAGPFFQHIPVSFFTQPLLAVPAATLIYWHQYCTSFR